MITGRAKRSYFLAWLALLAVLVQCLLPVSHALAMSRASQDILFSQSLCSYHETAQTADQDQDQDKAAALSGKLGVCPMCQAGAMGHILALPVLAHEIVRHDVPLSILINDPFNQARLSASPAFDPSRPRGPPATL